MNNAILRIIDEQSSPLFRIMSAHNISDPPRRSFDNNVCATHIGRGFVLSVAHNLHGEAGVIKSIDEPSFQADIVANANANDAQLFARCYLLDATTNIRHINITSSSDVKLLVEAFQRIGFDTRWETLYSKSLCTPVLIIQFKNNLFFDDAALTAKFGANQSFAESGLNCHTFLLELELLSVFYAEDFALYRIKEGTDKAIVDRIPALQMTSSMFGLGEKLYCLQGSSSGTNLGRMVNESRIEGILDHHAIEKLRLGGPIFREGLRYLLKGYFRFGSSGAPYLHFNEDEGRFEINAIQSEASPIQLVIDNNREGNFQYVNAIATPIEIISGDLEGLLDDDDDFYV